MTMIWQESNDDDLKVPDTVLDYSFRIDCKQLPLDHAYELTTQVQGVLPWLSACANSGIHLIHVAESGNGWMRPEDNENEILNVSRRTRFLIRIPKQRLDDVAKLSGAELDIAGHRLIVGEGQAKALTVSSTLFSRYIPCETGESEEEFIERQVALLKQKGVNVKKLMCGRENTFRFPGEQIRTRSIMLADLERDDAILLQQEGVGARQIHGFGLFIPHRGIAAVVSKD